MLPLPQRGLRARSLLLLAGGAVGEARAALLGGGARGVGALEALWPLGRLLALLPIQGLLFLILLLYQPNQRVAPSLQLLNTQNSTGRHKIISLHRHTGR